MTHPHTVEVTLSVPSPAFTNWGPNLSIAVDLFDGIETSIEEKCFDFEQFARFGNTDKSLLLPIWSHCAISDQFSSKNVSVSCRCECE